MTTGVSVSPEEVALEKLRETSAERLLLLTLLGWTTDSHFNTALAYDVLRATSANGFAGASCLESNDADRVATETVQPAADSTFFYLVRAENGCQPDGGSLSVTSAGLPRSGAACL